MFLPAEKAAGQKTVILSACSSSWVLHIVILNPAKVQSNKFVFLSYSIRWVLNYSRCLATWYYSIDNGPIDQCGHWTVLFVSEEIYYFHGTEKMARHKSHSKNIFEAKVREWTSSSNGGSISCRFVVTIRCQNYDWEFVYSYAPVYPRSIYCRPLSETCVA